MGKGRPDSGFRQDQGRWALLSTSLGAFLSVAHVFPILLEHSLVAFYWP